MSKIRLHLPAIPYTITTDFYSHDAFTGKVKRFSPMMRSRGFEVYHYGVETSDSGANVNIDLLTKSEWNELRIQTFMFVEPSLTLAEATLKNEDPTYLINNLSNWSSPLTKEFNRRFKLKLSEHYRSTETDIVCIPLGRTYADALAGLNVVKVETGIGYNESYLDYRIFESYAHLASTAGKENKHPPNYWFVIPNFLDVSSLKLSLTPPHSPQKVGFFGRITPLKGCNVVVEIARRFPEVHFVLCGQGDPTPYLNSNVPNLTYKPPIHGDERSDFLGSCTAVLCPSVYAEPFCGVAVEAQLCGTPVICADHGGLVETVEMFKTGLRCHTLADYCHGVDMALQNKFDRNYIRTRAANLYDMYKLAYRYEYVLKSILDVHITGRRGWYATESHIDALTVTVTLTVNNLVKEKRKSHVYLIITYYGEFPNYFQLYLDSLEMNQDILTVFLITDISLAPYKVPTNLIRIYRTLQDVRQLIAAFLNANYIEKVTAEALLTTTPYKLVDFKIIYPLLFQDVLHAYEVTTDDFVGWGDCDVIYGKLANFIKITPAIDMPAAIDIIGGWQGHFTAIKNTETFKNLYKDIPNYFEMVTDNSKAYGTDEIAYREPLIAHLKKYNLKMCFLNASFCDIIPECFHHLFRTTNLQHQQEKPQQVKNFFNNSKPEKNIQHLFYDKRQGTLTTVYEDGESYETSYCHLQKRKMELKLTLPLNENYYINENNFSFFQE